MLLEVLLDYFIGETTYLILLIWAAITTMLGMMIMFGASVINLRKLSPGFKRLASGEKDPKIPPVWCPVLTAATNAAKIQAMQPELRSLFGANSIGSEIRLGINTTRFILSKLNLDK